MQDEDTFENPELAELLWTLFKKANSQIDSIPLERDLRYIEGEDGKPRVIHPDMNYFKFGPISWVDEPETEEIIQNLVDWELYPSSREDLEENEDSPVRGEILNDVIGWLWNAYLDNSELIGGNDKEAFVKVYNDFEKYHRSYKIPFIAKGIIQNFWMDEDVLELRSNLRIRSPTAADKNWIEDVYDRDMRGPAVIVECEYEQLKGPPETDYPVRTFNNIITIIRLYEHTASAELIYGRSDPNLTYSGSNAVTSILRDRDAKPPFRILGLDKASCSEFVEFYKRYQQVTKSEGNRLSRPIRRYNSMFEKYQKEDNLVDCVVAIEGTLLDGIKDASISFRLRLRGGMLLDGRVKYDREQIRDFLKSLYFARSEIVHSDTPLSQILDEIENRKDYSITFIDSPKEREYLDTARYFLSEILLAYMDAYVDHGIKFPDVNNKMDKAALNAKYNLTR